MEDCCFICAEPLEWVAFGPCGHKEACSKCVMRMRFVLKDSRCIMCQQDAPAVFVTRAMGAFTASIPLEDFAALSHKNAREKGFQCLKSVNAYFDDEDHFHHMRRMCSFSHPVIPYQRGMKQTFPNLKELKKHILATKDLHFCDICVEHRKVFISEQELYTKAELNRHNAQGDITGPMAESGFKGHPQCKFCRKRFYGENEIYQHMQTAHEHCFICRRADPDKYVYYKDYNELEGHFRSNHFLCEDTNCLANKFVVFPSEKELKQHTALEHKDGMSKGQRREALTLPTSFQYGGDGASGSRPGAIIIGGGSGLRERSSGGRGNHATQAMIAHQHELMAAMQASMQSAQTEAQFSPEDFPAASGWAGGGGLGGDGSSSRWASAASSSLGGNALTEHDFPALPGGMSKAARRRANQRASISRGGPSMPPSTAQQAPVPVPIAHSTSAPDLQNASTIARPASARGAPSVPVVAVATNESWPSLGGEQSETASSQAPGRWSIAAGARAGSTRTPSADWAQQSVPLSVAAPDLSEAFPALPASAPQQSRARRQPLRSAQASASRTAPTGPSVALSAPAQQGAVSESLREANRLLTDKIRQRVDEDAFAKFKKESGKFIRHDIDAEAYFQQIVGLGLVPLTAELAALCPEPQRREELLHVFRTQSASATPSQSSWTPPEVVEAAAQQAQQFASWQCHSCILVNAPAAVVCEACKATRTLDAPPAPQTTAPADVINQIENELTVSSTSKKTKKSRKGKAAQASSSGAGASRSDNGQSSQGGPPPGVVPQGAWGGGRGAQLASSISAVNSAWGRR